MARPVKLGLDYFPIDTHVLKDIKIRRLMKKHKTPGVLLYFMLLCDIYESSFYVQVDQDYLFDLSDQLDIEDEEVKTMLDYMVGIGLFDAGLWEQSILTSKAIQERYIAAKGRYLNERKLEKQYLLVPVTAVKEEMAANTSVNAEETLISAAETPVQTVESAQSKEKDSKENESIFIIERECGAPARENDQSLLKDQWDQWKMDLLNDGDWCNLLIRIGGKGTSLLEKAYDAMRCFDDFNLLRALGDTVRTRKEYQSRFIAWWRHNHWETDMQILAGSKTAAIPQVRLNKPAARKSRYEEMMQVAEEAKLLTQQMFENHGFGNSFTNGIETASDYTV